MTPPEPQTPDVPELLPCPFCGGEPERYTVVSTPGFENRQVNCRSCGASAFDLKWNTRPEQPAIVGGVDREAIYETIRLFTTLGDDRYIPLRDVPRLTDAILAALTARPSAPAEEPDPSDYERGRVAGLEQAAKVAEETGRDNWYLGPDPVATAIRALDATPAPVEPGSGREAWYSIESAPKDATILELLVDYTDGSGPLQDGTVVPTVGWNALADTGEDEWQFFGWDWCQDYICAGKGKVIAWRPSRLNGCDDALGPILARPAADDAQ